MDFAPAFSISPAAFRAVDPKPPPTTPFLNTVLPSHSKMIDDEEDYEKIEVETLYPPNPKYNIAEKPWLPGPQTPYVLLNANLIDPRASKVHKRMTLHLAGGKVVSVAPTTAKDLVADFYHGDVKAQKIDAGKYFVCPGLIDCAY